MHAGSEVCKPLHRPFHPFLVPIFILRLRAFWDGSLLYLIINPRCSSPSRRAAADPPGLPSLLSSFHFSPRYIIADLSPHAIFLPKASQKEGNHLWSPDRGPPGWWRGASGKKRKESGGLGRGLKNVTHVNAAEEKREG